MQKGEIAELVDRLTASGEPVTENEDLQELIRQELLVMTDHCYGFPKKVIKRVERRSNKLLKRSKVSLRQVLEEGDASVRKMLIGAIHDRLKGYKLSDDAKNLWVTLFLERFVIEIHPISEIELRIKFRRYPHQEQGPTTDHEYWIYELKV